MRGWEVWKKNMLMVFRVGLICCCEGRWQGWAERSGALGHGACAVMGCFGRPKGSRGSRKATWKPYEAEQGLWPVS